jgi:DNA mismatch repair protein MutS2
MLIKKLDIASHIESLTQLFSREKDVILSGDINIHYKIINELEEYNLKPPPKVSNLDGALNYLAKQGQLKLDDIYQFVKIINYFYYLKKFDFKPTVQNWIQKINIPIELDYILDAFDEHGNIKSGFSEELDQINQLLYNTQSNIKQKLYSIINSKNIQPYLVDHQIHLVNDEQTLMVRAGFNHIIKAKNAKKTSKSHY